MDDASHIKPDGVFISLNDQATLFSREYPEISCKKSGTHHLRIRVGGRYKINNDMRKDTAPFFLWRYKIKNKTTGRIVSDGFTKDRAENMPARIGLSVSKKYHPAIAMSTLNKANCPRI